MSADQLFFLLLLLLFFLNLFPIPSISFASSVSLAESDLGGGQEQVFSMPFPTCQVAGAVEFRRQLETKGSEVCDTLRVKLS